MTPDEIRLELFRLQDKEYRNFQIKLIPTVDPKHVIGVRTPALRKLAKQLSRDEDIAGYLDILPHMFFDEDQLHAFVLSDMKDFQNGLAAVDRFLPYVNNWATCDQMSPKIFKKHRSELLEAIRRWIASNQTYSVRFGLRMLMQHFLDDGFEPEFPEMAAGIRSEEYYVRMMVAWYFATALAKQYDSILPIIEQQRLEVWTHNKAIQKAIESYRITNEQKEYLRSLRIH